MKHPKRYLTSGVCTTRRVCGLSRVTPTHFRVLTSWAGDPTPALSEITAVVEADGSVTLLGVRDDETPQFKAGIVRRVRKAMQS